MEARVIVATPLDVKAWVAEAVGVAFKYADFGANVTQPEEKPLTRAQAAEFLQVTPPTLDAWVKAGLVQRRTVGSEIRFLPSDLLASLRKPEISRVQSRKTRKRNAL